MKPVVSIHCNRLNLKIGKCVDTLSMKQQATTLVTNIQCTAGNSSALKWPWSRLYRDSGAQTFQIKLNDWCAQRLSAAPDSGTLRPF